MALDATSMSSAQMTDVSRSYDCVSITRALQQLFRHNVIERLLISDMVALPVIDQRNSGNANNAYPCTSIKLPPRKGVTEQWFEQMNDLLSQLKLTQVTKEDRSISLAELQSLLSGVDNDIILATFMRQYPLFGGLRQRSYTI